MTVEPTSVELHDSAQGEQDQQHLIQQHAENSWYQYNDVKNKQR
jgi:hypothetical protein